MAYSSVGLSPDGGGSWRLGRGLPPQLVKEWLLFGERVGAQRLQALGVVNRTVPPREALREALALAERLNQRAPNALASIKELVNQHADGPFSAALAAERDHFVANLHHANGGIGIDAFLNKQVPDYR